MKRVMSLFDQCSYIWENYNRYKGRSEIDTTVAPASMQIIHWMDIDPRFDNVIYYAGEKERQGKLLKQAWGEQKILEIKKELFEQRNFRHKKTTYDACFRFLLKDLYIKQDQQNK